MSRINYIKKPPFSEVSEYYHKIFDSGRDQCNYSFEYYWYLANEQRIWACNVSKNGEFYDNSRQLSLSDIRKNLK